MPEAVDVGSVLGGRYKVTGYVLASADKDLVLDGIDQVLNRPVSILVASPANAGQVAASAREVATGERPGNIQVLDLGITDGGTYLVTNRASAPDLLDLIVQQDAPYIEPFFTDTLGSEIFGVARSTEPESFDNDDHFDEEHRPERRSRFSNMSRKFGRSGAATAGAVVPDTAGQQITGVQQVSQQSRSVPPPPRTPPASSAPEKGSWPGNAKVTRLDEESSTSPSGQRGGAAVGLAAGAAAAGAGASAASATSARTATRFPAAARTNGDTVDYEAAQGGDDVDYGNEDYDEPREGHRKYTRVLVGLVLGVLLITAVVLAATQLGSLRNPVAADSPSAEATQDAGQAAPTEAPSATEAPEPTKVPPVATGVTRLVPGNQELDAPNDPSLPLIIDGNPATFWGSYVYANDAFGGLAPNLALVVELEEESTISEVKIDQLNGTGGSFALLLNDEPTLEGAEQIAQSGFTAPSVTIPVPDGAEGPATARYVIVNFTQLPRLSNIQAQFPWGLRIAEIAVS